MELSKRLRAVADLVTPGYRVADIGTDHGYVPIWLVKEGKIPSAIAMDVNAGPLQRADEHIREYGLENQIRTRKSDGLKELNLNEADSMIAAGMGGALIIQILDSSRDIVRSLKECILQPQSEIAKVRKYLIKHGFFIEDENIVYEDGKFYPMMKVIPGKSEILPYEDEEYEYGRILLKKRHPVLKEFLFREIRIRSGILENLKTNPEVSESSKVRINELEKELDSLIKLADKYR